MSNLVIRRPIVSRYFFLVLLRHSNCKLHCLNLLMQAFGRIQMKSVKADFMQRPFRALMKSFVVFLTTHVKWCWLMIPIAQCRGGFYTLPLPIRSRAELAPTTSSSFPEKQKRHSGTPCRNAFCLFPLITPTLALPHQGGGVFAGVGKISSFHKYRHRSSVLAIRPISGNGVSGGRIR